ncbi:hypothetical protein A2U01_0052954, partial [Trifolium medium]|nr:hypothetical protein [Trifolium medium]
MVSSEVLQWSKVGDDGVVGGPVQDGFFYLVWFVSSFWLPCSNLLVLFSSGFGRKFAVDW